MDFRAFQVKHSSEQIWKKTVETLNVDKVQILRENDIHSKHFKNLEKDSAASAENDG